VQRENWINRNHSHVLIPPEVCLIPVVIPNRKEKSHYCLATPWFTPGK
jgi:hypothetical protein